MSDDPPESSGEFLLYSGQDGQVKVECRFQDETLWLTQRLMAELFGVGVPAINKHLKNIFESGELEEATTVSKMEIVRAEGAREVRRDVDFYNLDAIISVVTRMSEWITFLHNFLELSNYPILQDAGKISAEEARLKAEAEYQTFRKQQDLTYRSDFDEAVKRIQGNP
ncbi:MAG: hypothetical protein GVY36_05665 [Verrucomicrobia bacterium]|jgi:hypothetical protein|nr:hypothetical protein [Verrucomicrobiota bacterium]